ncbi:MAG: hypothetical protein Q4F21_02085 [Lachnospiraceae bacterium]|nr:hypothetical protein [Lachnospiraceae bacterium]
MKLRFVKGLTCLMLAVALIGGCGHKAEMDSTSVYIRKDGSVSSAVYEPFDTGTYKKKELEVFVEDAVKAYNQSEAGTAAAYTDDTEKKLKAAITSLEVKKGDAILKMEYASCDDYMKFNKDEGSMVQLASGTVKGAADAGIDMSQFELLNTEGTEKISASDVDDKYHVLFVEGTSKIIVEGTIQYATADVKISEKDTAEVSSSGALSCIIFK